ncbi:MAG: cytochrome c oxidase subunit 3 [Candidatus Eiseniibacteriota bacterium]
MPVALAPAAGGIQARPRRTGVTDNAVFGMGLFVFTEVMLFAAFISAFIIVRRVVPMDQWPPPHQPRLPFERTAINTLALLLSGVVLYLSHRALKFRGAGPAGRLLGTSILFGGFFLAFQGAEWIALIRQGLTLTSSQIGSFFYLIVGAHALHAMIALSGLVYCWFRMRAGRLKLSVFGAFQLFWYFVVLMWPVLYLEVYR